MMEAEKEEVISTLKEKLSKFKKTLQKQKTKGAEILKKKM